MISRLNRTNIAIGVLLLFHLIGLVGMTAFDRAYFASLTPLNLLLTVAMLLLAQKSLRGWWSLVVVFAIGLGIEIIGVNTGFPFGEYSYGKVLGPQILSTPLIIGINWVIVSYGANAAVLSMSASPYVRAIAASALLVLLDFIIEPVAIDLGYWHWALGDPPISNYIGWLTTAFVISLLLQRSELQLNRTVGTVVYFVQFVFFALLTLLL